jgi:hypothetical protein
MRLITLCLLGLFALALTMPVAAEAASTRSSSRASSKVMKPVARAAAPARSVATTRRAAAVTRVAPARPSARPSARVTTSRQTAKAGSRNMAANRASQGSVVAERSNMTGRGARLTSWTAGLPAASGEQRDCPAGTMSTLARGHDDVIRCMPL